MDPERIAVCLDYTTSNSIISVSLFFPRREDHAPLSYANHIAPACNVRFLASERLERRQERAYKKENECDNVTEARKKRNSIINSDTDTVMKQPERREIIVRPSRLLVR